MLVTMFGSIVMLPPRTKRWAEAKVLADCINIKVPLSHPCLFFSHYSCSVILSVLIFISSPLIAPRSFLTHPTQQVIKLYLYNNEHALALSHHNTHIRRFGDFSRGWGIGEETFEFWSWMARQ